MFNSFDGLFIVRIVELLKIAINRRLYLFIVGKSSITESFFSSLERENNPRGLNLANRMRGEAIRTLTQHPLDAAFVQLWASAAPTLRTAFSSPNFQSICDVQHFLKCLPCLLAHFQSTVTILWIFFTISGMASSLGRPLRCSSSQIVRPV